MTTPLHIPLFNSIKVDLPAWFAVKTKNYGNPKKSVWFALANPMTTARTISTRNHEKSIDIKRKAIDEPTLEVNDWDNRNLTLNHFALADKERIKKMEEHVGEHFSNYPVLPRGRPEKMKQNINYNRIHKKSTKVQKYGQELLDKAKETLKGRPITSHEDEIPPKMSRLSSLASNFSLSKRDDSDSSSDSGSDSENDSDKPFVPVFPKSKMKQKKPSVSRGKPPLKRPEPKPANLKVKRKLIIEDDIPDLPKLDKKEKAKEKAKEKQEKALEKALVKQEAKQKKDEAKALVKQEKAQAKALAKQEKAQAKQEKAQAKSLAKQSKTLAKAPTPAKQEKALKVKRKLIIDDSLVENEQMENKDEPALAKQEVKQEVKQEKALAKKSKTLAKAPAQANQNITSTADDMDIEIMMNLPRIGQSFSKEEIQNRLSDLDNLEVIIDNSLKAKKMTKKEATALKGEKMIGFIRKLLLKHS